MQPPLRASSAPGAPRKRDPLVQGVVGLALLAFGIVLAACFVLLAYTADATNRITQDRETWLLQRAIDNKLRRVGDDIASASVWNEAYEKTAYGIDQTWAQVNFGDYFHQYMGHDRTIVFDAQGRLGYASIDGQGVPVERLSAFAIAVSPLAAKARAMETAKLARRPGVFGFDRLGVARAATRVGDKVYLVAAASVVVEPGYEGPVQAAPGPVVVSATEVGEGYLKGLDRDLGLRHARLEAKPAPGRPSVALRDSDGAVVGAIGWSPGKPGIGVYQDAGWALVSIGGLLTLVVAALILRVRRLATALLDARDRALAADRAKSEFVANMSHEIRTPLNGVLGMAQVMETDELSGSQRERLKVIRQSGSSLLALLNDLLDISKIQAGKLEITETDFDIADLAHAVCAPYEEIVASKGLQLTLEIDEELQGQWTGDPLRLHQILSNLISNAAKFTEAGSIALRARRTAEGVNFTVTDTGIGIEAHQINRLFAPFAQEDASTSRRYGGTGLGLFICRQLAELMGGQMSAVSERGAGSSFSVDLPLRPASSGARPGHAAPPAAPAITDRPLRILAAEDNVTNQIVLRSLLQPLAVDLTIANNGREALDLVAAAEGAAAFDLVLMDVQMPEMSGVEATQAIRTLENQTGRPRTRILALSANVMTHQIQSYIEAGMDGCVAKPIELSKLYEAIDQVLCAADAQGEASSIDPTSTSA